MTTLIIVRHGHTTLNDGDRFRGRTDTPLSEQGLLESELAAKAVAARWNLSAVYTSAVSRARMTAQAIGAPFGLDAVDEPGILDMDWGDWTGRSFAEVSEKYPELYRTCFDHPSAFSAPGGQSFEQLRAQSVATIKAIAERHDGEAVAIVTHTVNIRLILIGCLEMPTDSFWRIRQGTCAINALESEGGLFYLRVINDTCHTRGMPGARPEVPDLAGH
jgi:phosphoserine phosphatase